MLAVRLYPHPWAEILQQLILAYLNPRCPFLFLGCFFFFYF